MNDSAKKISNRCPDNSRFLRLFSGKASQKEKEISVDHILHCQKCKMKFEAMKELKTFEASDSDSLEFSLSRKEASELIGHAKSICSQNLKESERSQGFRFKIPKPIIACLLIALSSTVAIYFGLQDKNAVRSSNPFGLQLLSPKATVSTAPKRFKWTPVENADRYALKIIDEEMNTVYPPPGLEGKIMPAFEFELPESIRAQLVPQKTYIWVVEAYDDFRNFLTSESKSFVIK